MTEMSSSCEMGAKPPAATQGSRVIRFLPGFRWQGVEVADYKSSGDGWCGIRRMSLAGEAGEQTAFHLRYFEIEPGGFSSLEQHRHEHVVVVLRGQGQVRLGEAVHELAFGDTVYVAPSEVHQFRNPSGAEPFGFLCIVDSERDRPEAVEG
jgi:ribulose-bisphosphate carboxylase large chain